MIHGSLFSGILGADLAAEYAGVETAWCAEVDRFCNRVIEYRQAWLLGLMRRAAGS